jgi:hypothetical protein
MNDLEARFAQIDAKIVRLKHADSDYQALTSRIDPAFEVDHVTQKFNRGRDTFLKQLDAELAQLSKSSFQAQTRPRLYLKTKLAGQPLLVTCLAESLFIRGEFTMFQRLKYLHVYNSTEEIDLEWRIHDDLTTRFELDSQNLFCFYRVPFHHRLVISDNEHGQLIMLDRNLNLIRRLKIGKKTSCRHLKVTPTRILTVMFMDGMKSCHIHVFDFALKLLYSKKLTSNSVIFIEFSADFIYYKSRDSQTYVMLNLELNEVGRQGDLLNSWSVVLHSLTRNRAVVQNNVTREMQILLNAGDDQEFDDKENSLRVICSVKLDQKICLKIFVDAAFNVYMLYKSSRSGDDARIRLRCYDPDGRFLFERFMDMCSRHGLFECQHESLYFFDVFYKKFVV